MPSTDKETYQKVHELRSSVSSQFTQIWEDTEENARFWRMLQYSDDQLKKFSRQNRVPYVLDYVTSPMNTYLGDQRDQRADIVYLPVESGDEVKVELLNTVKDSVLRRNKFLFVESDIFQDGLIKRTGAIGYEWTDIRDPKGELRLFRIPNRQLTWDLGRRDYELSSAQWVCRTRFYPQRELIRKFPERKKEIEKLTFDIDDLGSQFVGRLADEYLKEIISEDLSIVALLELYERDYKYRYFIIDLDAKQVEESYYSTKKESENAIRDRMQLYEQKVVPLFEQSGVQPPPQPRLDVKPFSIPIILKSEVAQSITFTATEQTELPDFPYDVYHPYFDEGEYWGAMDLFKDPQRFINKTFSMIDHQMSTGSKGLLVIDDSIPEPKAKEIVDMWNKTGGVVTGVKSASESVKFIPPTGFDPRLIQAMELAAMNVEKKAGGSNFLGQAEGADEAASAIRQRLMRASASSFIIFDNFTRFKQCVGEKVAWYLTTYMSAAQKVRIEGEELTKMAQEQFPDWFKSGANQKYGFLELNTSPTNTIDNLKVDVIVDEAKHSVTKNQAVLEQIGIIAQRAPMVANSIPPELILDLWDLPASKKQQYRKSMEELKQMEIQKSKASMEKPPSLSASLSDITLLPPEMQAQFAQQFGLQLTEPVEEKGDGKPELNLLKFVADTKNKSENLAFKERKHDEQIASKNMATLANLHLEKEKIDQQERNKEDAVT